MICFGMVVFFARFGWVIVSLCKRAGGQIDEAQRI
jgi:hypothetical protein